MTTRKLSKAMASIDAQWTELENLSSELTPGDLVGRLDALDKKLAEAGELIEKNSQIDLADQENSLELLKLKLQEMKERVQLAPTIALWAEKKSAQIGEAHEAYDQYKSQASSRASTPQSVPESPLTQKGKKEQYKARRKMPEVFQEIEPYKAHRKMSNVFQEQEIEQLRLGRLMSEVDNEIKFLSEALLKLQYAVPELSDAARKMATLMIDFQLSEKNPDAINKFISASGEHLTQVIESVRDPVQARFWHSVVSTVKAFLHWLDLLQSKFTGATIDREGRPHFFAEPALPVRDAKAEYVKACQQMLTKLDALDQQNILPHANRY